MTGIQQWPRDRRRLIERVEAAKKRHDEHKMLLGRLQKITHDILRLELRMKR